ncbi:Myb DNA-bind 3 domain-containing protein [Abeliophyllum distichum]|uniref:Myb DNA-bind 3 domain-containing protein n=1 Tax=Abeliophyllum distichum TaxID=126358 RepID=A0ABD1VWZ2_9LAMI
MDYGVERLKGKWNRLRKVHRMFSELLGHTGVTWDPNTNKVNDFCSLLTVYPFVDTRAYDIVSFFNVRLTSRIIKFSRGNDEERQLEDDFLNGGVHVHVETLDDDVDDVPKSRRHEEIGTSSERRRKEPKNDKLEACMAQWSSTVSLKNEETELRTLYLKEKLSKLQGKSCNQSDSEAISLDPYSNIVCLDLLNNMEGVSNEVYLKALKAFKDLDFRVSFVNMPEARRGPILELL